MALNLYPPGVFVLFTDSKLFFSLALRFFLCVSFYLFRPLNPRPFVQPWYTCARHPKAATVANNCCMYRGVFCFFFVFSLEMSLLQSIMQFPFCTESVYVCVFFPFILDIKFVGRTSRGHTGVRFPSRWCFLPCYHGLDFDISFIISESLIKQSKLKRSGQFCRAFFS